MNPTLQSASRARQGYRPVWQKRFHDHLIRDDRDAGRHLDYLIYNPVRHGLCHCPHEWEAGSFTLLVSRGIYDADWSCACGPGTARPFLPPPVPPHLRGLD